MSRLGPYDLDTIVVGDSKELAAAIPDESVAMIMTDPVYWEIGDYQWLGLLAQRILIPGGHLVAQSVSDYRWEAEAVIRQSTTLTPRPQLTEIMTRCARMFKHKSFQRIKPYLWFTKGTARRGQWILDSLTGGGVSKTHHEWQDHPKFYSSYIWRLTEPGDVIFDPFIGGGTTAVATIAIGGRSWLGFEIDPDRAGRARQRISQTPARLFSYEEPEQLTLWSEGVELEPEDGWAGLSQEAVEAG